MIFPLFREPNPVTYYSNYLGKLLCAIGLTASLSTTSASDYTPRVAVVMCTDSYHTPADTVDSRVEMSAYQLVGLAGLVGVPYDTLTDAELKAAPVTRYTNIWMSFCPRLSNQNNNELTQYLTNFNAQGGSVLIDGHIGVLSETGDFRPSNLGPLGALGLTYAGWHNVTTQAVTVTSAPAHIINESEVVTGQVISQNPLEGSDIIAGTGADAQTLLSFGSGAGAHPLLTVIEGSGGQGNVAAISNLASYIGVATPFDSRQSGAWYYENLVMPVIIDTAQWLLSDGLLDAAVGLQLSHAPMTMVGRLDGDQAHFTASTNVTMDYLGQLAKSYGINTLYGLVSHPIAGEPRWDDIRDRAQALQHYGGVLGSHSATHNFNMSASFSEPSDWQFEVKDSIDKVSAQLEPIGEAPTLRLFINPGAAIMMEDYAYFAATTDLYMTHGYESVMPYGSGVMQWQMAGQYDAMPVIYNTPYPDFRALYDPQGTTDLNAIASQRAYLHYYQNILQRGALYNHMWHDYTIYDGVHNVPERMGLFELHANHVMTHPVYLPTGLELEGKMHIAQAVGLQSHHDASNKQLVVTLDFNHIAPAHRPHLSGMGLRVNKTASTIASVFIDSQAHHGFSDNTVILPPVDPTTAQLQLHINLGTPVQSRVTFASKALARIESIPSGLILTPVNDDAITRICVDLASASDSVMVGRQTFVFDQAGEACFNKIPATIVIDGNSQDWQGLPIAITDAGDDAPTAAADIQEMKIVHDDDFVYLQMRFAQATPLASTFYNNLYIDTDANTATGLYKSGIGAEFVVQNTQALSSKNGGWNEGSLGQGEVTLLGSADQTVWEMSIPRTLTFADGTAVFPDDGLIRVLFESQDSYWATAELAPNQGGVTHRLTTTPLNLIIDGDLSDWRDRPVAHIDPIGDAVNAQADVVGMTLVDEADAIFVRLSFNTAVDFFDSSLNNIFIDTDSQATTGFSIAGLGSEVMIQGGIAYSQKNGSFNEGTVTGTPINFIANGPQTEIEFSIAKDWLHPDASAVFSAATVRVLIESEDSNWTPIEFAPDNAGLELSIQ